MSTRVLVAESLSMVGAIYLTQLRKQCVLWLGAMFVYVHIRHVYLCVMCQLVPTLSSVFYCCRCLLWPGKYLVLFCVLVQRVLMLTVFLSQHVTCDDKCFICVSTNNSLELTTHPLQSPAHSPLSKNSRPHSLSSLVLPLTSFLSSYLPFFLLSSVSLFCPAISRKSMQNHFNSAWLCTRVDVLMCVHAYVHRGANMKQMFR